MELPKDWTDFKIVETVDGAFTGQIRVPDGYDLAKWESEGRMILANYTRDFLTKLLGYHVGKYLRS